MSVDGVASRVTMSPGRSDSTRTGMHRPPAGGAPRSPLRRTTVRLLRTAALVDGARAAPERGTDAAPPTTPEGHRPMTAPRRRGENGRGRDQVFPGHRLCRQVRSRTAASVDGSCPGPRPLGRWAPAGPASYLSRYDSPADSTIGRSGLQTLPVLACLAYDPSDAVGGGDDGAPDAAWSGAGIPPRCVWTRHRRPAPRSVVTDRRWLIRPRHGRARGGGGMPPGVRPCPPGWPWPSHRSTTPSASPIGCPRPGAGTSR